MFCCKAQFDTVCFSRIGDTVLYDIHGTMPPNSDSAIWLMYLIKHDSEGDSLKMINQFKIPTLGWGSPYEKINPDTLIKYNLDFTGIKQDFSKHEIYPEIRIKKLRLVGKSIFENQYIYSCKATILIKCKNKIIKKIKVDYMFEGATNKINPPDLCSITYWKKQNAEKYFIKYQFMSESIIPTDGVGTSRTWTTNFTIY